MEPSFGGEWRDFRRALEQRNALLRSVRGTERELESWEARLAEAAVRVDARRTEYVDALAAELPSVLDELGGPEAVQALYAPGWDRDRPYHEELLRQRNADREGGFTRAGPQRADLRLQVGGRRAAEILSRGQQKILACALLVAQDRLLQRRRGDAGLVLVDDLPAELDADHRVRLGRALCAVQGQVVMTAVQADLVLDGLDGARRLGRFHVEHGRIAPR